MENRSGLIVDTRLTRVSGHAERLAALELIEPYADRSRAITLGADRGWRMSGPTTCEIVGRWQIVAADTWDRAYLDLSGSVHLTIGGDGRAEFAFGALQASGEIDTPAPWCSSVGKALTKAM